MIPASQLEAEAADLRGAIASGEYARAQLLWASYAAHLEQAVRENPGASALLSDARALIDWSRQVVLSARTRAQDDLYNMEVRQTYWRDRGPRRHSIQVVG